MNDESLSDLSSNISDISYLSDLDDEPQSINYDLSYGSPININNFNIVHYNINSITADDRLDQLSDLCRTLNLAVLVITESKLDQTIPTNLITIPGYHEPVRRDRDINGRNGGGVLIYIAEYLVFQHKTGLQSSMFEHIWVDITYKNIIFSINALYRPPSETVDSHMQFIDACDDLLQKLQSHKATYKIVTSDLNFGNCYCKYPILAPKPLDATAPDLFANYGLTQIIDIPTRITEDTTSLIDLFFSNNTEDIVCHGTLPRIADHDGVLASFKLNLQIAKVKTKLVYDYQKADVDSLINYIKSFDYETSVFSHPVVLQPEKFDQILKDAFAQFVPCKHVTIRPNDQPWSSSYTRLLLRKKNRNYLIYKKISSDYNQLLNQNNISPECLTRHKNKKDNAHTKARNAANTSNLANRRAKISFYNTVNATMNNFSISAKKKCSILLRLMKSSNFSSISPLNEDDQIVNEPKNKTEIFNEYFASKSRVDGSDDDPPLLERMLNVQNLANMNTSPIEIGKLIRSLKKSHISPCGISEKFLQMISKEISYPFSKLLNNLFEIGHFPDHWKIAHVTPIFKRVGSKNIKSNYRPISILPSLSKVAESVIHERLLSHCVFHNIITERQAAYLKGDSTITQLLYLVHQIRKNWGIGKITQTCFLDISAAFDKVWHRGLLSKLEQI